MSKKFLVGVGNVNCYDVATGELLFTSKTMMDDSIDISTSSAEVRAGKGNALQYIYYHTGKMEVSFTESQFSLNLISLNNGSAIETSKKIWFEETITLNAQKEGTVTNTPVVTPDIGGVTVYGWVSDKNGLSTKVTFSTKTFTLNSGAEGDEVCVRYYYTESAATYVTVSSNIIPSIVRCVIDAQLGSSDSTGIYGSVQIEIPRLQISGSQTISLKSDGVSNTPLKGMALAFNETSSGKCASGGYYATVTEIINDANWYDNLLGLAIVDDDITIAGSGTATLDVRAIPLIGNAFKPPVADLTFTSSVEADATVGEHTGIVTFVTTGATVITVAVTAANTITTTANITLTT